MKFLFYDINKNMYKNIQIRSFLNNSLNIEYILFLIPVYLLQISVTSANL